ncbi:MAG: hypothetical protein ACRDHN_17575, partial [Thermomicrobiales bacterium]
MIFDSHFWPLTLLVAALATGIFFGISALAVERSTHLKKIAIGIFVLVLLLSRFTMYYLTPSFQGTLGGLWPLALLAIAPAVAAGLAFNDHRVRTLVWGIITPVVILLVVPLVQIGYSCWGPTNAMRYAELANIRVATENETVPPTDPNKMVQVSKNVAVFKGQTALTSTSQNLGSRVKINPDDYVLQAVQGHRYWIAPLVFANMGEGFWGPLRGETYSSPGYVVVDAQDPNKDASVHLEFHISLFDGGSFHQNLRRYLYQRGFDHGAMVEMKFEVDDNWRPHWIVSYAKNRFEGVGGAQIDKVIVVDVGDENPKVATYDLGKEPEWIERVMPLSMITDYVTDWGMYNNDYARENPWSVWWNIRKDGSLKPSEYDLNYTTDSHSVYAIPMTSANGSDHAVAGLVIYDTRKNEAVLYPKVRGFNTGNTVIETIQHAPVFLGKNLEVDQVQLYSIYGELTWMAVITNPQSIGKGFAGVALLHAHSQNASEVIFAPDMNRALGQYASQLARKRTGLGNVAQQSQAKSISGKVLGFGIVPGSTQSPNVWTILLEGDSRIFTVTRDTYAKIPMIKEGDTITISYLDLEGGTELAVSSMSDTRLDPSGG